MNSFPVLPDEHERLAALYRYKILDTPTEEAFDRITRLATHLFKVPIVLITLVDKERQWIKSCYGKDLRETKREISFCTHAILTDKVMVVPDATVDPRFEDNPLVTSQDGIRFYAGAPLRTSDNFSLGTICVIDTVPHTSFEEDDRELLQDLASLVIDELELRLALGVAREEIVNRRELERKLNVSQQALLSANIELEEAQRKLQLEIEGAAQIQRDLLPTKPPKLAGFELAASFLPAREVSGDLYDWQVISEDCVTFALGDVAGKGLPAALLMATVLATMRVVVRESSPGEAISYMSRGLERELENAERLVTLFLGQLDTATGLLRYVDAGHGHVFMRRHGGQIEPLAAGGLPFGVLPEAGRSEGMVRFGPGDALVVYSDGLLQSVSEPLYEFLTLANRLSDVHSARAIVERLFSWVRISGPLEDDLTVLVLRRRLQGDSPSEGANAASGVL